MRERPTEYYVERTDPAALARWTAHNPDREPEPDTARVVKDFASLAAARAFVATWDDPGFGAVIYRRINLREAADSPVYGERQWEWEEESVE